MADQSRKEKRAGQRAVLRQVLTYIRRCRLLLLLSVLLAAATVALSLYVPILLGRAIDAMLGAGQVRFSVIRPLLLQAGILVAVTALLQ